MRKSWRCIGCKVAEKTNEIVLLFFFILFMAFLLSTICLTDKAEHTNGTNAGGRPIDKICNYMTSKRWGGTWPVEIGNPRPWDKHFK